MQHAKRLIRSKAGSRSLVMQKRLAQDAKTAKKDIHLWEKSFAVGLPLNYLIFLAPLRLACQAEAS